MKYKAILFDLDGTLVPMDLNAFTKGYFQLLFKKLAKHGLDPAAFGKNMWAGVAAMVQNDGSDTNENRFWQVFCEKTGVDKDSVNRDCLDFYGNEFQQARQFTDDNPLAAKAVALAREKAPRVILATNPMFRPGDKMLSAMPLFHGFGLGVCIHSMLGQGGRCILVPRFTAESYAKLITKYRCNFIAGVPTLYEALLRLDSMNGADLSCLKGVFSGGDSLSIELKKKFDKFLYDHKASIQVREGYGTTETVTACCLTPPTMFKEGSIGVPFPDTYIKIVEPGTDRELPYGEEGEILLAGPTVMREYMNPPQETAQTLRRHADGLTWVYTGDLGTQDEEGFIYFKGRAKRMIISSGYNIYPGQLENILDAHEKVQMSCVIGVPDAYKMQKGKAFVKLAADVPANEETRQELMDYCRKQIARYAMPYDIEFREDLPKTLVGKVAYRTLEEEEAAKLAAAKQEEQTVSQ